ncbi:hypothetical protein OQA88_7689 [Cercophora sp. LCS_1]
MADTAEWTYPGAAVQLPGDTIEDADSSSIADHKDDPPVEYKVITISNANLYAWQSITRDLHPLAQCVAPKYHISTHPEDEQLDEDDQENHGHANDGANDNQPGDTEHHHHSSNDECCHTEHGKSCDNESADNDHGNPEHRHRGDGNHGKKAISTDSRDFGGKQGGETRERRDDDTVDHEQVRGNGSVTLFHKTFPQFKRLPFKLRRAIWLLNVDPITITTEIRRNGDNNNGFKFVLEHGRTWNDIELFQICQESRAVAMSSFGMPTPHSLPFSIQDTIAVSAAMTNYEPQPTNDTLSETICRSCLPSSAEIVAAPLVIRKPNNTIHIPDREFGERVKTISCNFLLQAVMDKHVLMDHKKLLETILKTLPRLSTITITAPKIARPKGTNLLESSVYDFARVSFIMALEATSIGRDNILQPLWYKVLEGRDNNKVPFKFLKNIILDARGVSANDGGWGSPNQGDSDSYIMVGRGALLDLNNATRLDGSGIEEE